MTHRRNRGCHILRSLQFFNLRKGTAPLARGATAAAAIAKRIDGLGGKANSQQILGPPNRSVLYLDAHRSAW